MKAFKPLSVVLSLWIMLWLMAACTLPIGQPAPAPSLAPEASTSQTPASPPPAETPTAPPPARQTITPENAASLVEYGKLPVTYPQGLVWAPDSQAFGFYVSDSSLPSPAVYTARLESLPSLSIFNLPAGNRLYAVAPDLKTAALSSDNTRVLLVDFTSGSTLQTIVPGYTLNAASFSPDNRWLLTTSADTWAATLWDASSGAQVKTLTGFQTAAPVYGASVGADNATLLWFARATLQTQDITSGQMGPTFSHEDFISAFALSRDGNLLVTAAGGTFNGEFVPLVYLWDARSGAKRLEIPLSAPAWALALSSDSRLLALAVGSQIIFYDTGTGQQVAALDGHTDTVTGLAFSPDGSALLTSSADNSVRVWLLP